MYTTSHIPLQTSPCLQEATIYRDLQVPGKALIFYLHGGGLLYGNRQDLPELHKTKLTENGYILIALDYPLAPAAQLGQILTSLCTSIHRILSAPEEWHLPQLPYVLWGRSSGAYLALLIASKCTCDGSFPALPVPAGVISYYGYGFLTEDWANQPAPFYTALPRVPSTILDTLPKDIHTHGPLETHYSAYVYARQTGDWRRMICSETDADFRDRYTLHSVSQLPCPLFCTHALEDPDVPFPEYQALAERYHPAKYITGGNVHDFDRNDTSYTTKKLLTMTLKFLNTATE